ncbi:unnamed protein product, partial [Schistosoma margrebowiei]
MVIGGSQQETLNLGFVLLGIHSYNLKHPPFIATPPPPPPPPPSSSSSPPSLLNKQNKKMIKRSVTFEQSINSKSLLSSMTSTSSSSSSFSSPISQCCTNLCNKQNTYTFSYLLRVNPPILPGDILNYLGFTKSTSAATTTTPSTPILSRSNVNASSTGKIKVIICINQEYNNTNHNHNNQGLAITTTTALNTIGSLLLSSSNNPLNTIHLKMNKNTCDSTLNSSSSSCIQIDESKRIITLLDPTPSRRRRGIGSVLRNYKFDNIVTQDTLKREFYSMVLNDALSAVLNGKDSCILTIGHKATGKTHSMIGYDYSPMECGIIPCGISWLYQLLNYQKQWYNTRFSVRISAVEITGLNEEFRDLLANTKAS